MSNKAAQRSQSAALIRRKHWEPQQISSNKKYKGTISSLPVSQSRFIMRGNGCHLSSIEQRKNTKASRSRSPFSQTSQIWRKVHSTRSQMRLKSMRGRNAQQQPIRINLIEKVERLKGKNDERQQNYRQCMTHIERITLQRAIIRKHKGQTSQLHQKILQLLAPFEEQRKQEQVRYQTRLLRMKKN